MRKQRKEREAKKKKYSWNKEIMRKKMIEKEKERVMKKRKQFGNKEIIS